VLGSTYTGRGRRAYFFNFSTTITFFQLGVFECSLIAKKRWKKVIVGKKRQNVLKNVTP
jgi:hypothetical protein